MTEYVSINTSVAEILSAANGLVVLGGDHATTMTALTGNITTSEGTSVWGSDEFAEKFLKNYHGDTNASESIKGLGSGAHSIGAISQTIGNNVVTSMFSYSDTDTANSSDIDGTAV
jgi:hypothetical protein